MNDFDEPLVAYCFHCESQIPLRDDGTCPSCGERSIAYPAYLQSMLDRQILQNQICEKYSYFQFELFQTRGEAEYVCTNDNLLHMAAQMMRNPDVTDMGLGIYRPLFEALPKLDIVMETFRNMETGERTLIYEEPFNPHCYKFWGKYDQAYSMRQAMRELVGQPVFLRPDEGGWSGIRFFELLRVLAARQVQNGLWYAALSQGFYLLPLSATQSFDPESGRILL